MKYLQFYYPDPKGKRHILGSDGTQPVDGRLNRHSIIAEALKRIRQMRFVKPNIIAFTIHEGRWCYAPVAYDSRPDLQIIGE